MEQVCHKCKNDCGSGEILVVCEGFCESIRRFHASCAGLTDEEAGVCLHTNVMFMCDDCRELIENVRFRSIVSSMRVPENPVEKGVDRITNEIAKMSDLMNQLNVTIGSLLNTSESTSNTEMPSVSDKVPLLSSTKVWPDVSTAKRVHNSDEENKTFKLYISNIANDVTEEEVKQMISEAISVENIHAINCLKPPWRDVSTMDFVSYKVVIDRKYRSEALNSSSWPKGIRCREFKDHAVTTWRPGR